ncbi:NAD(P)-binding domain-containing protein [Micropruina sp.]|uniref:NAD(P)-binding domain-containing protein n=1 Tax=Micropruina sp. TaxID=2737536 RepID=UPI0039E3B373
MAEDDLTADYAVIGVGSIAEAIVTGLCEAPAPPSVVLAPRSRKRTARLAARYPTVRVAADNQAAASAAGTVLLCLRPQDAGETLSSLRLTSEQRVISVMASVSAAEVAELVGPVAEISRAIPGIAVASRNGFTPVFPPAGAAQRLFDDLGGSMVLESERLLDAVSVASATVAAHLAYLQTVSSWLAGQGVELPDAQRLIASVFAGATAEFATNSDFAALVRHHATPGGLNEHFEQALREADVYAVVDRALGALLDTIPPS